MTDIAMWVRQVKDRYNAVTIECDTGGLGKTIAHELIKRHGIPVNPAEKTDKMSWIALLNDDLRQSKLFVDLTCQDLADQYMTLTKDEYGREDPRLPNDFCDGVLYAYRRVYNYLGTPEREKPAYGTKEWLREEEEKAKEYAEKKYLENFWNNDDKWI